PGRGGATGVAAEWVTEENAREKLGVPPSQVADYLALVGDSSDNVPGARGIGPKTAVQLLRQYRTVEELIAHASDVGPARASKSLRENAEEVRLSKRLVTIMTDLAIELDLDALRVGEPNHAALRDVFLELEFRELAQRHAVAAQAMGAGSGGDDSEGGRGRPGPSSVRGAGQGSGEPGAKYRVVEEADELVGIVEEARACGLVAVAAETSTRDPLRGELVGLSLAVESGGWWYLPFGHVQPFELSFEGEGPGEVRNLPALSHRTCGELRAVLEDEGIGKVGHDLKRSALALSRAGVTLRGMAFDVMVASYVLDPGRRGHGITELSLDLFALKPVSYAEVTGSGRAAVSFAEAPVERAASYLCEVADLALRLRDRFTSELEGSPLAPLMSELEMPLIPVLTRMELTGIAIDEGFFREMRRRLVRELELVQQDIFKLAGGDFNLNSTPQLREVLFERLELPVLKRTKTGPSTDAGVLEELAVLGHEVPRLMMEYRELEKLRSTYVDALPQLVNPRTGRIHTSFNQTVAATGRLSSSDPNLQNIPIRTALGREIRKGFVAAPEKLFVSVDYSQIELRVLAHFSGDEAFVTAFTHGVDIHRQTASVIFDVPVEDVTTGMRAQAKTVNFATLYVQGPFGLARQLGISRDEARDFIDTYFQRFQGVRDFLDAQVEMAKKEGYVETLMGRRRYVPELLSKNWNVRQFGERVAQNTPIQGTAADLMKKAMIDVESALDTAGAEASILLQVHDELLIEVASGQVDEVRDLVVEKMETAVELRVPLVVDCGVGRSWFECKNE
ncbi:MAG TPA: DNA polymerase I, partial [Longimicrobiales bacterium]|nr:DNA polymerase I [Longimicrobiales bacterium]